MMSLDLRLNKKITVRVKCLVSHTQKDKLLFASNTSILKARGSRNKTRWISWLKWKLTLVESPGILCLCKAIYEQEPQLLSRFHLCSFVKANAREKPALTERKNNHQLDPDDGTIMAMRRWQKWQGMPHTIKSICMKPLRNLSKLW